MSDTVLILGVGSNLGSPIQNLREVLKEIKKSDFFTVRCVASIYESDAQLPDNLNNQLNQEWNNKYLNSAILCELRKTADSLDLIEELKRIEQKMGRKTRETWAPRVIDIDILWWNQPDYSHERLNIPHTHLLKRPFALLPALELMKTQNLKCGFDLPSWASGWASEVPFNTVKSAKYFWPQMVGILNVTPDSFSEANSKTQPEQILKSAEILLEQGADIIDVGAESTRPNAKAVNKTEEIRRLKVAFEVLEKLKKQHSFKVSLDSRNSEVVQSVCNLFKIDFLNDVEGFESAGMQKLLRELKLPAFVMHSLGVPPQEVFLDADKNPCEQLSLWWEEKLRKLHTLVHSVDNLIMDVGIGFGKTKEQNLYILNNLDKLNEIKHDVMIGHSRKSYQSLFSNRSANERDLETALITKNLNLAYVQYLRIHDITSQKIALRLGGL